MADLYDRLKRFKSNTTQSTNPPAEVPSAEVSPSKPSPPLPDSLKNIPGVTRARDLIEIAEKRDRDKKKFLETIGVSEAHNERGAFGLREDFFPLDLLPYPREDITGTELALQIRDESLSGIGFSDILFLDTETTGLAGGTGTVPFLTGAGFFEDTGFRVRQFLMRDYGEEPAVLAELNRLMDRFPAIASYNGKCFDVPILQSRFLLNRLRSPIGERPHADFLFTARRFWRDVLPDCTLLSVERYLTGRSREDDIPGEQIPYVYFDFLRGLRMQRMRPVMTHNASDILTLALIASRSCRMLRLPPPDSLQGAELAGIARCYTAVGDWDHACWYFERAANHIETPAAIRRTIQKHLSTLYKRLTRHADACRVWEQMAVEHGDLHAHIELAKYYEHIEKDAERALHFTEQAIILYRQNPLSPAEKPASSNEGEDPLEHRRIRLLRKSSSKKSK